MRMNSQTRIIVLTALCLGITDIAVRVATAPRYAAPVSSDIVSAHEFRLTDRNGNVRATMSLDDNDEPGIKLFDRNGTMRAQLDTFQNTPSLILCDKEGGRRVYFGMDNNTGNGLYDLYDENRNNLSLGFDGASPGQTMSSVSPAVPQTFTYQRVR